MNLLLKVYNAWKQCTKFKSFFLDHETMIIFSDIIYYIFKDLIKKNLKPESAKKKVRRLLLITQGKIPFKLIKRYIYIHNRGSLTEELNPINK